MVFGPLPKSIDHRPVHSHVSSLLAGSGSSGGGGLNRGFLNTLTDEIGRLRLIKKVPPIKY